VLLVKRATKELEECQAGVSYRYLIPVTERRPEGNTDVLYAFKSRGFGGEVGLDASETVDYNVPVAVVRENTQLCTYFFNLFTPTY